jgi:DNA-binding NarL/FixJ family response regulator
MTKIALADDHHLIRKSLRTMLEAEPGFEVVGEAADGRSAIALVENVQPDVLLLDLGMPRVHGLDVIAAVAKLTQVLVVSMHSSESYVAEAFRNGARGYLVKESMPADLVRAIREVAAKKKYLSPGLPITALNVTGRRGLKPSSPEPLALLTRREKVVLQMAAEGHNNIQIAKLLFLSPRTVESHRASFMRKLKLRSQTEIVRFALRKNLISA